MLQIQWSDEICTISLNISESAFLFDGDNVDILCQTFRKAALSTTIKAISLNITGHISPDAIFTLDIPENYHKNHGLFTFFNQLLQFPKYLSCNISGYITGLCVNLLCFTDFIIADDNVILLYPNILHNMTMLGASSRLFEQKFGSAAARKLLLLGEAVYISDIRPFIVTETVYSDIELLEKSNILLDKIKQLSMTSILANKDLMINRHESLSDTVLRETQSFMMLSKQTQQD